MEPQRPLEPPLGEEECLIFMLMTHEPEVKGHPVENHRALIRLSLLTCSRLGLEAQVMPM